MATAARNWEIRAAKGTRFKAPRVIRTLDQVEHKHGHNFRTHQLNSSLNGTTPDSTIRLRSWCLIIVQQHGRASGLTRK